MSCARWLQKGCMYGFSHIYIWLCDLRVLTGTNMYCVKEIIHTPLFSCHVNVAQWWHSTLQMMQKKSGPCYRCHEVKR